MIKTTDKETRSVEGIRIKRMTTGGTNTKIRDLETFLRYREEACRELLGTSTGTRSTLVCYV